MEKKKKKVLIKGVNWVGDTVLSLPTLRVIKCELYSEAEVVVLVKESLSSLFEAVVFVDRVISYKFRKFWVWQLIDRFNLISLLRKEQFDIVFILPNSFDAALLSFLGGIPRRIGYAGDLRSLFLTDVVVKTAAIKKVHQVDYYYNIVKSVFPEISAINMYDLLEIPKVDNWVSKLLEARSDRPFIGLNPGAAFGSAKRWPEEKYAQLAHKLKDNLACEIVLFGDKDDLPLVQEIKKSLACEVIDTAGITSLAQVVYLISKCAVFVTNDTGLMHIAGVLGVFTIAVFGPTKERQTSPLGKYKIVRISEDLPCVPCMKRECPLQHHQCMELLDADVVFQEVLNALKVPK